MIHPLLLEKLLTTRAFKKINELSQKLGRPISEISAREFTAAAEEIGRANEVQLLKRPNLSDVVSPYIDGKTLKNMLDPNSRHSQHMHRIKKLNTLLFYAGISENEWGKYKDPGREKEIRFNGYWFVYRFDDEGIIIKRTILHISEDDGHEILFFRSLYTTFHNGVMRVFGSLLNISFTHQDGSRSVEISANIGDNLENPVILSGIIRSTIHHSPAAKCCLLYYLPNQKNILDLEHIHNITRAYLSPKNFFPDYDNVNPEDEQAIYEYLVHKKNQIIAERSFSSLESFRVEVSKYFREYKYVKGRYLAFIPNFTKNDTSFYQVTLEIDGLGDVRERILLERDRVETEIVYYGHATIIRNTLRLSNTLVNDDKKSEYLFEINLGEWEQTFIQGITIGTDKKGFPCADACIAISYDLLDDLVAKRGQSVIFFGPGVLKRNDTNYSIIDRLVKNNTGFTLEQYYQTYKSIRRALN